MEEHYAVFGPNGDLLDVVGKRPDKLPSELSVMKLTSMLTADAYMEYLDDRAVAEHIMECNGYVRL